MDLHLTPTPPRQPSRTGRLRQLADREDGFTLIELLVVIAIIAILIALLTEAIQDRRKQNNAIAAVGSLEAIVEAQDLFHDGADRWAATLAELHEASPELIDGHLASGVTGGYTFELGPVDRDGWAASATPLAPGVSGGSTFVTDSTGVIREQDCRAGQVWDHEQGRCVPDPAARIGQAAIETIGFLDRLGSGLALAPARELADDDAFVATVGRQVDADADGLLTFDEILGADPFTIAADLVGEPADPREAIGGEDEAGYSWQTYQRWLTGFLQLGVGNEGELPAVPIPANDGSAAALLGAVPAVSPGDSLEFLHAHVAGLDVRGDPVGDMAHRDADVNEQRRAVLLRDVERMGGWHEKDMEAALTANLTRIRDRADGDAEVEDWVVGPAATRIVSQIDLTLEGLRG